MSSVARHLSDLIAATAPIFQMAIPASGEMPWDIQTLTLPCMTGDLEFREERRSKATVEAPRYLGNSVLSRRTPATA